MKKELNIILIEIAIAIRFEFDYDPDFDLDFDWDDLFLSVTEKSPHFILSQYYGKLPKILPSLALSI